MPTKNLQLKVSPALHAAVTKDDAWRAGLEKILAAIYLDNPLEPVRRRGRPKLDEPKVEVKLRLTKDAAAALHSAGRGHQSKRVEQLLMTLIDPKPRTAAETVARTTRIGSVVANLKGK